MSQFRIEVKVKPRRGLLDPEGKAIHHALNSLGWDAVSDVRVGKTINLDIDASSAEEAVAAAEAMCRKLLANPVTEDFDVAVERELQGSGGMKVAVVTFPGSNCDHDLYKAAQQVGADAHFVWHRERGLGGYDAVLLPGGFSYGDYLRAGAIARMSPIMEDVVAFAKAGGPVLGICNGFQILCEAGLLPGALIRNATLRFESLDVRVRVERNDTLFTGDYAQGQVLRIPIAHGEGNYEADEATLESLESEGRVVFRYVDAAGEATPGANPNGSWHNIAGIMNAQGNVLGMMPHPERAMEGILGSTDGVGVFTSIASSLSGLVTQ